MMGSGGDETKRYRKDKGRKNSSVAKEKLLKYYE